MKPVINNKIYDELATDWWNPDSFLNILETGIQPLRSSYIRKSISNAIGNINNKETKKLRCLDIGCGGGIITEDLAKISNHVCGIDLSEASLDTARKHAEEAGLNIDYRLAAAESLPFEDNTFDLVSCCDVLEHVDDLATVIKEVDRVLAPGGIFVYDTVNRTIMSYLSLIWVAQDFILTRFAPKNAHVWHKFIKPKELLKEFATTQLEVKELVGMSPSKNPLMMLWYIFRVKSKKIDFAEFGNITQFKITNSKAISYIGYCQKPSVIN